MTPTLEPAWINEVVDVTVNIYSVCLTKTSFESNTAINLALCNR